ncbi:MAG TPA: SurA N-terminal domain-containing protein [Anaerolineae bacterium]|nr:SurA N-terminal domain-containing protein [Anaerolineae bacterium]
MPKVKPTEPITKKQLSRREQERRQQRILGVVFGLTAAAVVFVLGFGWYQEYVAKPSAPVATVNGKAISTRDYQAMVKYNDYELRSTIARAQSQLDSLDATNEDQTFLVSYMQQQIQQLRTKRSSVGLDTYDQMVDDELIRQEAARRGIQITAEELQLEIEQQFGYDRNPPTPTPTPITATVDSSVTPQPTRAPMTQTEFETNYGSYVAALRKNLAFSEQTFRRLFESSLYHTKLQEALALEVPASEEQVHARHILVATEDEAKEVLERLHAGEDFGALAKELSTDTGSRDKGGDLVQSMAEAFAKAKTMTLAVAPEGTRAAWRGWKSGFYYIALAAGAPIVMSVLDYGTKTIALSGVLTPSGDYEADLKLIKSHYARARGLKERNFSLES